MKYIFTFFLIGCLSLVQAQCPAGQSQVTIVLTTDNYPTETSWQLKDRFGNVLLANPVLSGNSTYTSTVCVPSATCLYFSIADSYGDGICCSYGNGNFKIYLNNVLQLSHNGQFGSGYNYSFNCQPGESCNTAIAITTGTYTAPGNEYFYRFKPTQLGIYDIGTCNLTNTCDTKIWVYENCNGPFTSNNTGTIMFNDDYCGTLSSVSGVMDTAKTYIVRVGSNTAACGAITFSVNYHGPVTGCTTYSACNYNPLASVDDGSCIYYPNPLCQAPDLTIVQSQFISSLNVGTVNAPAGDCRVAEHCLSGYGTRTVINFDTYIKNIGNLDYYIGGPNSHPGQFTFNNCHGHAHYEGYAEYRLYKSDGSVLPIGFKNGFCVLDFDGCPDGGTAKFTCSNMGISKQCGDIYHAGLDCQWVDITDVDTGRYVLAAKVNWDQSADALGHYESNYNNNWAQACIHIYQQGSAKTFSLATSCPSYTDCAGVQFGNAVKDCNGVCNGTAKMGDLNNSGTQQSVDAQLYVNHILHQSISPTSCNDLNNDNKITVWDAALMANCAKNGTGINTLCDFPRGVVNPNHTATLSIGAFNASQNYFEVNMTNPTARVLGYEFTISGATILNVVNTAPADYPETPEYLLGGNKVICLSYRDSTIAKSSTPQSVCRIHYTNPTGKICISNIVEIVDKQYEAIQKVADTTCLTIVTDVGLSHLANTEHYFSVVPNPAADVIQLSGYTASTGGLLEIRDLSGRLLHTEKINVSGLFNYPMSLSGFQAGVYYITLSSGSGVATKPVVLVK